VHLLEHVSLDEQFVETLTGLLSTDLLNGSKERVGLVQSVQEADGLVDGNGIFFPQVKQLKSLLKVIQPGSETSGGHPGLLGPLLADFVEEDVFHEVFHSGSHGQLSLESQLKVLKVDDNLVDESVNQLALLQVHVLVRSTGVVSQFRVDLIDGESLGLYLDFVEDSLGEFSGDINDSGSTFSSTTTLGLKLNQNGEQVVTLGSSEIDFGVGVHSESERGLSGKLGLNMLDVLSVSSSNGALERSSSLSVGEKFGFVKKLLVEEMIKVRFTKESIPVIDNVTTIHDLTDKISEIIPWHFTATTSTFHVVLEYDRGITEITFREGVSHVESLGSELSALAHDGVEIAETEKDSPDFGFALIEFLLLVHSDSTLHVGLESCRRLVGELDGSLEQVDRNTVTGVRRQEESEVLVRSFNGKDVKLLGDLIQESRHEMHVLQHDPLSFLVSHF